MILVLSNVANDAAPALVESFGRGAASLVTASNLYESLKLAVSANDFASSVLTLGGVRLHASEISGVVSTIAYFLPQEFYYIAEADREYVCAEASAFFIYFLAQLHCPKVNPPSVKTLSGLGMHRIEWMKAASGLGVPVWPVRFVNGEPVRSSVASDVPCVRATIVGEAIVEADVPDRVCELLNVLSRQLAMPYLCGDFAAPGDGEYLLTGLWSVPDITAPENRAAIARFMGAAVRA
jgi:hypothetical protein